MRRFLFILLSAAALLGCQQTGDRRSATAPGDTATTSRDADQPNSETASTMEPITSISGTVEFVNQKLRYAVLDFYLSQMPELGQRLNVYRQGEKVGELTVSGPSRNQMTVADIAAGEAQAGDEVRID